jgi:hypothetical protein
MVMMSVILQMVMVVVAVGNVFDRLLHVVKQYISDI